MIGKNKNKIALLNILSTIILQGLAFISGPIFSNTLGTNNYGIAAVYLTWVQVASTVFSLQAAGTIAVARVNFPMEEQSKYQSSVLTLATLCYCAFSIITITICIAMRYSLNIDIRMIVVGLVHGWGLYVVGVTNNKFTYEFKAGKNFFLSISVSALTIIISLLLIKAFPLDNNYWGRILGQSIVYCIVGTLLFITILRLGKTLYNREYWKFSLPFAIPTIFHVLAHIVLNQNDKVMLQRIEGNSAAGIYALACTFGSVLSTIWSALNNSWVPFYYEYTRLNQIKEMRKHAKNYIELFTVITVGFIFLAKEVFHIYANAEFWSGTDLIPLFSMGYYFVFLYSFPVNYEFYNKKTKTIAIGTMSAAILNIALNYILIGTSGITGAVIATVISHGLQFIFHYICAYRISKDEFPFKMTDFIPSLLIIIAACGFYFIIKELWIVRWIIGAVIGIYEITKIIKRREIF